MVLKFSVGRMGVIPVGMQMDGWKVKVSPAGAGTLGFIALTQTFGLHRRRVPGLMGIGD
jgi:hypothetical protein